jgi:hypothetical protein
MWAVAVAHAAILQATSRSIRADSLVLKVRSQEARGARRLHGASDLEGRSDLDGSLIASFISDASLCGDCLARKTGSRPGQVRQAVTRMAGTVKVRSNIDRCDGCLKSAVVYRLGNAFSIPGRSGSPARQVIEELDGGPFCIKCLATRLRLMRVSVEHVVAELRRKFLIDSIEPCAQCGSQKTIVLYGRNRSQE